MKPYLTYLTKSLTTLIVLTVALAARAEKAPADTAAINRMNRYYELYNKPGGESEFYALSRQLREEHYKSGNRERYYTAWVNEMLYDISHKHSYTALRKAQNLLEEMKTDEHPRYDMIYNILGTIYKDHGNYRMAKNYMMRSLENTGRNDTTGLIGAYIGLANLEVAVAPGEARHWAEQVMPLTQKRYQTHHSIALSLRAMSYFYEQNRQLFNAAFNEMMDYTGTNQVEDDIDNELLHIAKAAFDGQYQRAIYLVDHSQFITEDLVRTDLRIQIFKMMGNPQYTIAELERKTTLIDSLSADMAYNNMNEINAQMDVAKTRAQAARQRQMWLLTAIALLIVIIGLLLWWGIARHRMRRQLIRQNKELEVALDRAEESDRMKTSFIEHVSHEIRTPLNVITGFAQVISNPDFELEDEERNKMVTDISRNTVEITNIVNELAQDESKEHYEMLDDVDLNQLCDDVINRCELLNTKRLQLNFHTALPAGKTIRSNYRAIDKIVSQLMKNAIKFTHKGSITLDTELSPDGNLVRLVITDTGIGIAEEHQERIFDRFYKVDSFTQGIGIGLTMSRKIAQLLDGSLTFDKSYQDGARFVLTLPVQQTEK